MIRDLFHPLEDETDIKIGRELEIGKAAEYLVCADLILKGYRAFLTDQGLPYDIVLDHNNKFYRIQVKGTMRPRPVPDRPGSAYSYFFNTRRAGKRGTRTIKDSTFDILALVALDIKVIAYIHMNKNVLQCISLRNPANTSKHANRTNGNIDCFPIEKLLKPPENGK